MNVIELFEFDYTIPLIYDFYAKIELNDINQLQLSQSNLPKFSFKNGGSIKISV